MFVLILDRFFARAGNHWFDRRYGARRGWGRRAGRDDYDYEFGPQRRGSNHHEREQWRIHCAAAAGGALFHQRRGKGFNKSVQQNIELNVKDKLTINFNLQVGDVQQEVTVEGNSVQVELQSAAAQSLISGTQVRELALNTRNYEQLVRLMPGVVFTGIGDQLYLGVSNPFSGASNQVAFAMNGGRTSQNNWTIDGGDNVDRGANLTLLNYPNVDAVDEFRALRGEYTAEFGRNAGGMLSVITKSGTNQFHGDAYEFFRNDKLAANNFLNNLGGVPRPPLRYNNFGYTVGGPSRR